MNPLLEQFLSEAREFLQGISEMLLLLEKTPGDSALMDKLFRLVHTLKGNSGLFDFPEMTRVLHAGEDLMDEVRNGGVSYSQGLADNLLDAMDFVNLLCDDISSGIPMVSRAADSASLADTLRRLIPARSPLNAGDDSGAQPVDGSLSPPKSQGLTSFADIPEPVRMEAFRRIQNWEAMHWIEYSPDKECFFQGDDPFFTVRQTPSLVWGRIIPRQTWPSLAELDAYSCLLNFQMLSSAHRGELDEHFRYVLDQVSMMDTVPLMLVIPQGDLNGGPVYEDFISDALNHLDNNDLPSLRQAALTLLELSSPELWLSSVLRWLVQFVDHSPDHHAEIRVLIESIRTLTPPNWSRSNGSPADGVQQSSNLSPIKPDQAGDKTRPLSEDEEAAYVSIVEAQRRIFMLDDHPVWHDGRLKAAAGALIHCCHAMGDMTATMSINSALEDALAAGHGKPLLSWLDEYNGFQPLNDRADLTLISVGDESQPCDMGPSAKSSDRTLSPESPPYSPRSEEGPKFGRRAEDSLYGSKVLKVDQAKIDRLMNLIGEMVVSKNALPYLAHRAENLYGVRELSREIKAQYAVINRIAEEMQDGIMQVRMMPVSFVFQRFPRLVRDLSRKLGKEVQLVLEGEETEADKNIIESLADPLIHIIRNSLDHGLETPKIRRDCGKPETGTINIRAVQEADRVIIEIMDDGKGIDPSIIKRLAYEKGLIDEMELDRISDRDAVNLVFLAGFSTAESVSDLSGRGVGMDVVRDAVAKVNGVIHLESTIGKGTHIRISLPLSMAVTKVMIIESDGQIFGIPMDHVVETVRVPCSSVHTIKQSKTVVLRGRIVPLKSLNSLLDLDAEPMVNADDELALLVVRVDSHVVGIMVDDFRETVDIIQKPLNGVLSGLTTYSGSALMGDGSVLMVLNVKEIMSCR